jgi:hypothetical protein
MDILDQARELAAKPGVAHRCDFCMKWEREVKALIKSESDATICNECVGLCVEILKQAGHYP